MANTPLKNKINRFFYRNRDKGIPNLMLWISIGNVIVYVLSLLNQSNLLFYSLLRFDYHSVLRGQVWRLFSYPFCYLTETGSFLGILSLLFYYWCGKILDEYWGPLRFNFYYFSGLLLTDAAAMAIGAATGPVMAMLASLFVSAAFLNLSLLLAVATVIPEQQIRIWFVIPVKMKWLAWLDVGLTVYEIIRIAVQLSRMEILGKAIYLVLLLPLIPILNYLLFFGKQAADVLPDFLRYHPKHRSWQRQVKSQGVYGDVIRPRDSARFRCTVCGRTELSNPGLDFRYCSKCAGYRCYCEDHINNHTHITE